MPAGLPKRKADALLELGLSAESYYVGGWPPIWGLALIWNEGKGALHDGDEAAVIETTTGGAIFNPKYDLPENCVWPWARYVVRRSRSIMTVDVDGDDRLPMMGPVVKEFKLQRQAIAWVVEDLFINQGRHLDRAVLRRVV